MRTTDVVRPRMREVSHHNEHRRSPGHQHSQLLQGGSTSGTRSSSSHHNRSTPTHEQHYEVEQDYGVSSEDEHDLHQASSPGGKRAIGSSSCQFWSFNAWKSFIDLSRKERRLREQLQNVKRDLGKLTEVAGASGIGGDGDAALEAIGRSGSSCSESGAATASAGGAELSGAATTSSQLPNQVDVVPRAELEALQKRCAELEQENQQAEQGLDRALQTLHVMRDMKDRVLRDMENARRSLVENANVFCFHSSNHEPYLDQERIAEVVADMQDKMRVAACEHHDSCTGSISSSRAPFHEKIQDFSGYAIPRVDIRKISHLQFLKDFVARNRPCIFTHCDAKFRGPAEQDEGAPPAAAFGAFSSLAALRAAIGSKRKVRCNVTPDGYGDAVLTVPVYGDDGQDFKRRVELFVKPFETEMPFGDFCDNLQEHDAAEDAKAAAAFLETTDHEASSAGGVLRGPAAAAADNPRRKFVPYMSMQDDCLRQESAFQGNDAATSSTKEEGVAAPTTSISTTKCTDPPSTSSPSLYRQFEQFFQSYTEDSVFDADSLEALNLWVGDDRSVSSFHKDNYENLYLVTSGRKVFWLAPPSSVSFLHFMKYQVASYRCKETSVQSGAETPAAEKDTTVTECQQDQDASSVSKMTAQTEPTYSWSIQLEEHRQQEAQQIAASASAAGESNLPKPPTSVPWCPIDVRQSYGEIVKKHPRFGHAACKQIFLDAGEMLYLPRLWYHAATQEGPTIAVNAWYDMCYDHLYCHHTYFLDEGRSTQPPSSASSAAS
ncbi:unnamed protein product [Amoebophrya sp. A120]|nr:unnamed protein product [Amoebophrya sp. A120]|eukprot:GSA120T00003822001.1